MAPIARERLLALPQTARMGLTTGADRAQHLYRLVPVRLVPAVARRRTERLWQDDSFRRAQEARMDFLVGESERAHEVPELARAYTEQMLIRSYLRWHPRAITHQRVKNIERLTERDLSRGLILSFMHHHRYDGMFASLVNAGGPRMRIVVTEGITTREAGTAFAQHLRVMMRGGDQVLAETGTKQLATELVPGAVLAIAPDFIGGRTPVTFLGRRVLAPFGTPRLAQLTDSPVLTVTHRRDADGPYVQVEEPLDPRDFPDGVDLLNELLRIHAEAVLDWPEAIEAPHARFSVNREA